MSQIVAALTSSRKEVCVQAFGSMCRVISGPRCYEVSPELGSVTAALGAQLVATDSAVVGSALELLLLMIQRYKGLLFALDELLPAVFRQYARATDATDAAVTRALCAVLEEMLNNIDADFLVPSLARAMERGDRSCVRMGLVMLKNVMAQQPEYFDAPHHVRPHLGLLAGLVAAGDSEVASMARQVLVGLFQQSPTAFTSAVWQLPYEDKKELRKIVPGLEAELSSRIASAALSGRRVPAAPVVPATPATATVTETKAVPQEQQQQQPPLLSSSSSLPEGESEVETTNPRLREYISMATQAGSITYGRQQLVTCLSGLIEGVERSPGCFGARDAAACVAAAGVWAGSAHEPHVRALALALLRACAGSLVLTSADVTCAVQTLLMAACDLAEAAAAAGGTRHRAAEHADRARVALDGCQRALEQRHGAHYLAALMRACGTPGARTPLREQALDRLTSACTTVDVRVLRSTAADFVAALAPLFDAPEDAVRRKAAACVAAWARTLQSDFAPLLDTLPPLKRKLVQLVLQARH